MGCSSGMVSSPTSMRGGWKVCTIDSGRPELLRYRPTGLFVTGVSMGDEGCTGDEGRIGVELRCMLVVRACRGLANSLGGDEEGVGLLESLLLCPDSWDINERTGDGQKDHQRSWRRGRLVNWQDEQGGGRIVPRQRR